MQASGGIASMDGIAKPGIADIMHERVLGLLALPSGETDAVGGSLAQDVLRIYVHGLLVASSAADVAECAGLAAGILPVADVCDMHSVIGHRALMKVLALHPVVARACGLDADHPIEDPVILAQTMVAALSAMSPDRRARFIGLFREETATVAAAAGRAVRDVIAETAARAAACPGIAAGIARHAASLPVRPA
jgi:hypothetical protein